MSMAATLIGLDIETRNLALRAARLYLRDGATIRQVGDEMGLNEWRVHELLRKCLPLASPEMDSAVARKARRNLLDAPRRGGLATRGVPRERGPLEHPRESKYSDLFKERVLSRVDVVGIRAAAREFGIPKSTIFDWYDTWR